MKKEDLLNAIATRIQEKEAGIRLEREFFENYKRIANMSIDEIIYTSAITRKEYIAVNGIDIIPVEVELLRRVLEKL